MVQTGFSNRPRVVPNGGNERMARSGRRGEGKREVIALFSPIVLFSLSL